MSSQKLDDAAGRSGGAEDPGLLVIRNDKIVCEWYAPGQSATTQARHGLDGQGPRRRRVAGGGHERRPHRARRSGRQVRARSGTTIRASRRITLRQLGSHTSGIEDAEADDLPHEQLTGWKGDFWKRRPAPHDPFTISRDTAPVVFEPGRRRWRTAIPASPC